MRAVFDIARNDLRLIFNDRSIWINLVIIPLIISYIIGVVNSGGGSAGVPNLIIDVINHDDGALSQQFLSDLKASNPNFVLCPMDDTDNLCELGGAALDEPLIQQRLQDQTSLALVEIPANFSADIDAGDNVSIVYRSNEDASAPSYILQAVQAETQKLGGALTAARVGTDVAGELIEFDDAGRAEFAETVRQNASDLWAQDPAQVEYVVSQQAATEQPSGPGFKQSIPGIASMYVLFIVLPAAASIILERKTWTLQRLATLPISRAQILGGKLLARFATGMLEYALMFAFGFLLGVRYGSDPLAILLLAVSFSLAITAITLALTGFLKNEAQARGIGLFLTLTMAPLGGAWWPLDIVPAWMRTIGHISPVAWVMDGFNSVVINGGNLGTVIVPIVVLLGMAALFFVIGVRRFKFTD